MVVLLPKFAWCIAHLGSDGNWWIKEVSEDRNWDFEIPSLLSPEQVKQVLGQSKAELEELREQISMYQNMEDTMKSSLSSAQRTADKVLENAYHEADLITRRAQLQADKEVSVALRDSERQLVANRRKAESVLTEAQEEAERSLQKADEAKARVKEYAAQIRSMLVEQLELLERDPALQTDETERRKTVHQPTSDDLYADLPYDNDSY